MQTIDYMKMIGQFMDKYGQVMRRYPDLATEDERSHRAKLIREEARELCDAIESQDLIGIADGIADLLYITFGACHVFGIPIESVIEEVHRSNMSKTILNHDDRGNKVNDKGHYSKPQIAAILEPLLKMKRREEKSGS